MSPLGEDVRGSVIRFYGGPGQASGPMDLGRMDSRGRLSPHERCGFGGDTSEAKARFDFVSLRGAEAPLFHVTAGVRCGGKDQSLLRMTILKGRQILSLVVRDWMEK